LRPKQPASRRTFLKSALLAVTPGWASSFANSAGAELRPSAASESNAAGASGGVDREKWISIVEQVSQPVLAAISQQKLRATMPVEAVSGHEQERAQSTHLEAVGRLLCGLAPWLEGAPGSNAAEEKLRAQYREWARLAIRYGSDPRSPDALNFGNNHQSVVDAAFLALAIVRAPNELWAKLDSATKQNLVAAMHETRKVQPGFNNWLLFSAMIEAFLCRVGENWDPMRVDYGMRELQQWYMGDGIYGDGPHFHWDYYNSFVIQPMMLNIFDALGEQGSRWSALRQPIVVRAQRYAAVEERLISPEGSYPPVGRSLAYRFGAFQHLAEMSLRRQLPQSTSPAQVRCALTTVMTRQIGARGTFDEKGWLTIGFSGHQRSIGESYISTGSLYLCSAAWLPLGLPVTDEFWSAPPQMWTQQKAWGGVDIPPDHAITE
jgi:hypothetical protein